MTRPLANDPRHPGPRSAADRDRARAKLARKWVYLLSTTSCMPHTDLERPLLAMVDELFAALTAEPLDLEAAERVGARMVALNCVDKTSMQVTVDVLAGPLMTDEDTAHLGPERVARLFGALAAGFGDALKRRTTEQQDSMCRALMEVARKAIRAAETRQAEVVEMSTELTLLRRHLSHQLLHDALTGLPNQQFFTTRLEEVLNSGTRTRLYRIELNGFAVLDDGLGGPRSDVLLISIATRLRGVMAGEDTMVARFDRASFTVLQECSPSTPGPAEIVGRLTEALAETTYVTDEGLAVTANVGVVESPPHGADPVELLQAANIALRLAKEQGPGEWRLLGPDEDTELKEALRLAAVMPGALETGRLSVGYRLVVDLADERPVGVDAYPCWPEAGLEGRESVALADRIGLSPQLGAWLLRTAGAQVTTLPVTVCLSPNQSAAPDLIETVADALPPTGLQLSMPATEVFDGRPQAVDNLTTLAKAGVRVAVHDFAGNPSDLVRLADFPLRVVILAPRLVTQARNRAPQMTKAVTNTIALVHECGAKVTVHDISTTREAGWWHHAGADMATGPLFPIQGEP